MLVAFQLATALLPLEQLSPPRAQQTPQLLQGSPKLAVAALYHHRAPSHEQEEAQFRWLVPSSPRALLCQLEAVGEDECCCCFDSGWCLGVDILRTLVIILEINSFLSPNCLTYLVSLIFQLSIQWYFCVPVRWFVLNSVL